MERNFSGYMIENSIYLITDKRPYARERKTALTVWRCVFRRGGYRLRHFMKAQQLRYYFV
jgi:hypothetical protein